MHIVSLHGPSVTVIRGGPVLGATTTSAVLILKDGVTFGSPGAGFTLTGGSSYGVHIDLDAIDRTQNPPESCCGPRSFGTFTQNNFYGNDRNRPALKDLFTLYLHYGSSFDPGSSAHCGVLNVGALAALSKAPPPEVITAHHHVGRHLPHANDTSWVLGPWGPIPSSQSGNLTIMDVSSAARRFWPWAITMWKRRGELGYG